MSAPSEHCVEYCHQCDQELTEHEHYFCSECDDDWEREQDVIDNMIDRY